MSIILRVDHADSPFGRDESTARIPSPTEIADRRLTSIRIEDILDGVSGAEVTLFRSDWVEILPHVSRTADAFTIEEDGELVFGGRLDDFQFSGETVSLRLRSFEADAVEARPVGNIEEVEEPFVSADPFPYLGEEDDIIVEELIDGTERFGLTGQVPGIDTLDTGTIETVEADARVRDSHQFPGVIMRDLTERTGAILRYNADQTVDYVERLGDDLDVTLTSDALVARHARHRHDRDGRGGRTRPRLTPVSRCDYARPHRAHRGDPPVQRRPDRRLCRATRRRLGRVADE